MSMYLEADILGIVYGEEVDIEVGDVRSGWENRNGGVELMEDEGGN